MLVPVIAVGALLLTGSLWVIPITAVVLLCGVAYEARVFYTTPMLPTTTSSVPEARYWERIGLAIMGAAGLIGMLIFMVQRAV